MAPSYFESVQVWIDFLSIRFRLRKVKIKVNGKPKLNVEDKKNAKNKFIFHNIL